MTGVEGGLEDTDIGRLTGLSALPPRALGPFLLLATSLKEAATKRPYSVVGAAGGTVFSRLESAVTSCAGANGLASRTLLGTPLDAHSSPCAPVM
jgi:hypothetical protein